MNVYYTGLILLKFTSFQWSCYVMLQVVWIGANTAMYGRKPITVACTRLSESIVNKRATNLYAEVRQLYNILLNTS